MFDDDNGLHFVIIGVVFSLIIVFAAISYSEKSRNANHASYDKEHCIDWDVSENGYRVCVCYDNEKCANFLNEAK